MLLYFIFRKMPGAEFCDPFRTRRIFLRCGHIYCSSANFIGRMQSFQ